MFDDDSSWDGLSGLGTFSVLGAWGLSAWLCFGMGNQQGLEAAERCIKEPGCAIQAQPSFLGIESRTVVHPAAASPASSAATQ